MTECVANQAVVTFVSQVWQALEVWRTTVASSLHSTLPCGLVSASMFCSGRCLFADDQSLCVSGKPIAIYHCLPYLVLSRCIPQQATVVSAKIVRALLLEYTCTGFDDDDDDDS